MIAHRLLDETTITALHAAGLTVVAWTVNDPERAAELVAWGVDGLTTDSAAIAETQGGGERSDLACPRSA
jgi:glycerophosphoryl diester phosphodiesterase